MNENLLPAIAGLALANLLALLALAFGARGGRNARKAAAREPAAAEAPPPILRDLAGDPLEALVSEVEEEESAARGEARLKEDIARWRRRVAGGGELPRPATAGRRATGRSAAESAA